MTAHPAPPSRQLQDADPDTDRSEEVVTAAQVTDTIDRAALVAELRRQVADRRPEDDTKPWSVAFLTLADSLEAGTLLPEPGEVTPANWDEYRMRVELAWTPRPASTRIGSVARGGAS